MTANELRTGTVVVALAAVLVVFTSVTPFGLLAGAIWAAVAYCRHEARRIRQQKPPERLRDNAGLRYHLCAFGMLYLVPIGAAVTFYCLLAVYLTSVDDSASIGWLISMQQGFETVSGFFADHLKLSESAVLAVLVAVYLLTCLLLAGRGGRGADAGSGWRFQTASRLARGVESYTRYSGPAAAGLATLASFSLFGMQLGTPATELRLRLKVAQQGYAEISRKIESDLSHRVADGLYAKIQAAFPPSYRDALSREPVIASLVESVQAHAAAAKSSHDVSVASVDRAVLDEAAARQRVDALVTELRVTGDGRTGPPGQATPEQIRAARTALAVQGEGPGIDLLGDGRRTVTLQVEKVVSERIVALTKPLTDAVPMMEPLMQAFVEALDKSLQDRIGRAYDRLVEVAMRTPQDLNTALGREARDIVGQTEVDRAVDRAESRAQRLAESRMRTLSSLRAGPGLIDRKVTETLAARRRAQPNPRTLNPPELLRPLPLLPPLRLPPYGGYPGYGSPDLGGYRPPGAHRPVPPRIAPPPRPVRPPPPRIFVW